MRDYFEIPPSPSLSEILECCWISTGPETSHRVVPDGCADIVLRSREGQPELLAVGPMTRFEDVASGDSMGFRFRPGMWSQVLRVPAREITDATLPLEDLWGSDARSLFDRIANAGSAKEGMELLAESVGATETRTRFQRAIGYMERRRGFVSLDDMARDAGLSSRQFRRVCLRETGLSPKLLARILRFRHAEARATGEGGAHAELAADCGFTDQAHMISEFRRFSGRTPNGLC